MIEIIKDLPNGVVGLRAHGEISKDDYDREVVPLLENASRESRKIKFLYQLGPEFKSFSPAGAWTDFRVGMEYLGVFQRCAIVTDVEWIRGLARGLKMFLPFTTRLFRNDEFGEAVQWLASPQTSRHLHAEILENRGVVLVEPTAALRAEDFDSLQEKVDPWIQEKGRLNGVVVHAGHFPGWENLGGMIRHFRFVQSHHEQVRRVAIAVDGVFPELIQTVANYFINAEVKSFAYDQKDAAVAWASEGSIASSKGGENAHERPSPGVQ